MTTFRTGVQDLISDSDGTNGVYNAMTPALPSAALKTIRCRLLAYGSSGVQVQPYIEFSLEGVNWWAPEDGLFGALVTPVDGNLYTPAGWGSVNIFSHPEPMPFVRFGLCAKSTSTGDPRLFQAELEITSLEPVDSRSIPSERQLVYSSGGENLFAITPVLDAAEFDEARVSVELESEAETSGAFVYRVECRQVNYPKLTPSDYSDLVSVPSDSWQTATLIGSTFTSLAPAKRFIQFYARVKRSGGSGSDFVMGRLCTRVDLRKV